MNKSLRVTVLAIVLALGFGGVTDAQVSQSGPYYSTPAWDQQLPASSRWIILTNWNSQAVLDRETGLVWQQDLSGNSPDSWKNVLFQCQKAAIGGRAGWRLPSVEELATLWDPNTGNLFAGAPFTLPAIRFIWTSTTYAPDPSQALIVFFSASSGQITPVPKNTSLPVTYWCVRGYQGTQSPQ